MQSLGDYLDANKLSQKAFAAQLGTHYSIVSKLCAGKIRPGLDMAYRIKRLTGGAVPFEAWIGDHDLPEDPAFWVDFLSRHVGGILEISRFFEIDGGKALLYASGQEIPSGLHALQAFSLSPWAFQPSAEVAA
jgi:transcriptional regulator with XRE-family HTH domain